MAELVTIKTRGGVPFTVSANEAPRFEALLNDLEAAGYPIKGDQSGGYNYRNIAGTKTLSNHAHGAAVDVNWSENARGTKGNIDPALARELAAKHGMTWGGDWKNPDPMHFEVARGVSPPVQQRGLTSYAGLAEKPEDKAVIPQLLAALGPAAGAAGASAGGGLDAFIGSLFKQGGGSPTAGAGPDAGGGGFQSLFGSMKPKGMDAPNMAAAPEAQQSQSILQPMQRAPIDLSRLRSIIASRPLGIGGNLS